MGWARAVMQTAQHVGARTPEIAAREPGRSMTSTAPSQRQRAAGEVEVPPFDRHGVRGRLGGSLAGTPHTARGWGDCLRRFLPLRAGAPDQPGQHLHSGQHTPARGSAPAQRREPAAPHARTRRGGSVGGRVGGRRTRIESACTPASSSGLSRAFTSLGRRRRGLAGGIRGGRRGGSGCL